jgi:Mn-dependent DtxR family transcriptional regulator
VDKAIFLAKIELYKNVHGLLISGLSSKDRMFLWAMAQDENRSEFGEIARRMDVSTGYASKYRERLINAGVIYSSGYGELSFTLPFMKEYIEKEFIERLGGEGGKRRL